MKMRRGAVGLLVQELLARAAHRRGAHRRDRTRPQADAALHQHAQGLEHRRRHPRDRHVPDARRSDGPAAVGHRQHADRARSAALRRRPGGAHSAAARGARRERRQMPGHRRRRAGHGRSGHRPRPACADARLAQRRPARTAWRRRPDCRCTSRTPAAPARWRRCGKRATSRRRCATSCSSASRTASASASSSTASCCAASTTSPASSRTCRSASTARAAACGAIGCWEAHISNLATLTRYFGRAPHGDGRGDRPFTIDDLIARARTGDGKAVAALQATARYLGLGLGSIVNIMDPDRIFIGGEITTAWDLIESTVRTALAERALTPALRRPTSSSFQRKSIRACGAPPCSSRRRCSPRPSWPD